MIREGEELMVKLQKSPCQRGLRDGPLSFYQEGGGGGGGGSYHFSDLQTFFLKNNAFQTIFFITFCNENNFFTTI